MILLERHSSHDHSPRQIEGDFEAVAKLMKIFMEWHLPSDDAGHRSRSTRGLYRKLGFTEVEPYYELPHQLRDWLVFMKLDLR